MDFQELVFESLAKPESNLLEDYKLRFKSYAFNSDLSAFEEDFNNLFSKTDGIAVKVSRITFQNKSLFHFPNTVQNRIQGLEEEYYNKFKKYIL